MARENSLKAKLQAGGPAVNAWCSIPSSYVAEVVAHLGFDSVTIDMQHGALDYADAFGMLQAISTSPATPLVRVPWNDPAILMKVLDAGAMGVIAPMINTVEDARALVGACRYPPLGFRSIGPNRAVQYAGADYWSKANATVIVLAMIETQAGVDDIDQIVRVPGLDGIYVGPGDLSLAYGEPPSMRPQSAVVREAIARVARAAKSAGVMRAIHTDGPEAARQRFAEGFQLCTLQSDVRYITIGASSALAQVRSGR